MKSFNERLRELLELEQRERFHLKETIRLNEEWSVDVSTVEIPLSLCGGYETCLFFMREGKESGSEVVAIYSRRSEAELGHKGFANEAVLRCLLGDIKEREYLVNRIQELSSQE